MNGGNCNSVIEEGFPLYRRNICEKFSYLKLAILLIFFPQLLEFQSIQKKRKQGTSDATSIPGHLHFKWQKKKKKR